MTKKVDVKIIKENIIEIPSDIAVKIVNEKVIFEKGDVKQVVPYNHVYVSVECKDNKLIIKPNNKKKPFLSVSNTIKKIINNALEGFTKDFVCKMQIVYAHFPITVKIDGDKFIINNFYGEKKPRILKISPGVKIKIDGKEIILSGKDKQAVGNVAGSIESRTKLKDKDYRVFDDGIYIAEKVK